MNPWSSKQQKSTQWNIHKIKQQHQTTPSFQVQTFRFREGILPARCSMPDLVNVALQLLHSLSQLANILLAGIGNLCKLNNTNTWTHAFHHMHKTLCMSAYDHWVYTHKKMKEQNLNCRWFQPIWTHIRYLISLNCLNLDFVFASQKEQTDWNNFPRWHG